MFARGCCLLGVVCSYWFSTAAAGEERNQPVSSGLEVDVSRNAPTTILLLLLLLLLCCLLLRWWRKGVCQKPNLCQHSIRQQGKRTGNKMEIITIMKVYKRWRKKANCECDESIYSILVCHWLGMLLKSFFFIFLILLNSWNVAICFYTGKSSSIFIWIHAIFTWAMFALPLPRNNRDALRGSSSVSGKKNRAFFFYKWHLKRVEDVGERIFRYRKPVQV